MTPPTFTHDNRRFAMSRMQSELCSDQPNAVHHAPTVLKLPASKQNPCVLAIQPQTMTQSGVCSIACGWMASTHGVLLEAGSLRTVAGMMRLRLADQSKFLTASADIASAVVRL